MPQNSPWAADAAPLPDKSIQRVLIYRLGSLGDTVVALPCFHLIERSFPHARRVLLTNIPVHAKAPASAAVLGDSGLVHGYMRYTVGTRNPFDLLRLAGEVRRFAPEVLVYLMPLRSSAALRRDALFFRRICGVRRIVGLPEDAGLTRVYDPATEKWESEAVRLAKTLHALGDAHPQDLANWDLRLTPSERDAARSALGELAGRPLVVCGPGTKQQINDWGRENWRLLLGRISAARPDYALAMVGAKEDAETADFAAAAWTGSRINLCGQLVPRETAALLQHATLFLGPDSGPMHLAARAAVPCVAVFSARGLPGVWFPVGNEHRILYHKVDCWGCGLEICVAQRRKCITSITIEEVATAVESALSSRRGAF